MAQAQQIEKPLTKRALDRAASKGVREASRRAMETAGSVVTVKDGWVVRIFENGDIERIEKLEKVSKARVKAQIKKLVQA